MFFKINGQVMAEPNGISTTLSTIDKYTESTIDGKTHREIAAKKHKYQLNFEYIPDSVEFQTLWNTLAELPEFAQFTIPNPNGENEFTFEGYIGDMSVTMMSYWDMGQGRQARWKSLQVNIIER